MTPRLQGYPAEAANGEVAVPPFNYNPSAWSQRIPICVMAFAAFLICCHMALYQWRLIDDVWDPVFGDQSRGVLDSNIAGMMHSWIGIPDAALGAFAYLGDAVFGLAGSTRRWQYRPWLVILFGLDVIPLGAVSVILVVCQGAVVGEWCFLCLVTAAISLALIYWAYDEVYVSLRYLYLVKKKTKSAKIFWRTVAGYYSPEADEVAVEMLRERAWRKSMFTRSLAAG